MPAPLLQGMVEFTPTAYHRVETNETSQMLSNITEYKRVRKMTRSEG